MHAREREYLQTVQKHTRGRSPKLMNIERKYFSNSPFSLREPLAYFILFFCHKIMSVSHNQFVLGYHIG